MINRYPCQNRWAVVDKRIGAAWINSSGPSRHTIIDKVGEVRLGIMCVGAGDTQVRIVSSRDAIANQQTVAVKQTGHQRRINVVTGSFITSSAVVCHR